jgi:glycine/D-amino acid oxidase-like deaminating enzyme
MQSDTISPPTVPAKHDDHRLLEEVPSAAWHNPRSVSKYDFVSLGGGPAGTLAACAAAALGAKVALIERDLLGGTCLNTGCIPSKSILRTSRLYADMRGAENFGAQVPRDIRVDFAATMARYLTVTLGRGRTASGIIGEEQLAEVRTWIANYHKLKDHLEKISEINRELLRRDRAQKRRG